MSSSVMYADAIVIGGGAMGCATSYYLKKQGVENVILLEKKSLLCGSSGRCAGGFRQQFPTLNECKLAKQSIEMIKNLPEELSADIELNIGGYLVLAYTEEQKKEALEKIKMQNSLGIDVRWIDVPEISSMAPWLNTSEGFIGAAWCPSDGILNPFKFTMAYANSFKKMGGKIFTHTEVINITKNKEYLINTKNGDYVTKMLFNCTGAYGSKIGDMLGVNIPVIGLAREKIVTEPIKKFQPFLCNSPLHTLHFNQTMNGNFLMSCANMNIKQRKDFKNTWRFAEETAAAVRRLVPSLGNVKILRQWAGYYEITPDGKPFIGGIDGLDNYYQTLGFNGHGLMLAPAACQELVNYALGNDIPDWFNEFNINRLNKKMEVV